MTTKPGRFSFSLPSPYVTQLPTDGLPIRGSPVFIMKRAGLWLFDSLHSEWTNAIGSTCLDRLGKSDDPHLPHCPYCFHSNGDFISGPTSLMKKPEFLSNPGSGLPSCFASSGLWSQVSTWLWPPLTKTQMTA